MQVPERLALIGGSILLASTLVFTLKSQVANLLPKWENALENINDDNSDITNPNDQFFQSYNQAKQKHWQTGYWGSSRFYVDDNHNMHVGQGTLMGTAYNNIGKDTADNLQTLSFDENIKLPSDASRMLGDMKNLTTINGTEKIDTSDTTDLFSAFSNDVQLTNLDLNSWDVCYIKGGK